MHFGIGSIGISFIAGVLSILSPCVLPVLPLGLAPAATEGRSGVLALAAGLVASFVSVGLFVATIGFAVGLDGGVFRTASAVLLACVGIVLLSASLQRRFALATGRLSGPIGGLMAQMRDGGLGGQFVIGVLLGAVWSPCVGPTLGAASLLAAQGRDLASVAAVMGAFGFGTALSLLLLGILSREVIANWRGRLVAAGQTGKRILGVSLLVVAALILTGADRVLEGALVAASPAGLTILTTKF
jgi:cytochrome c-type biogenesis protein